MGNWASIHVHADQDSIAFPGELCAMSDPIGEDLIDDIQEFFSELIEVAKDPILYPVHEQYYMKELEIKGPDPDNVTIRVILDDKKLKKIFPQKEDDDDVCRVWYSVNADRKKLHMKTVSFSPKSGEWEFELHSMFHVFPEENHVKCEIWGIDGQGNRRAGKWVAGYAEHLWVKPLLLCRLGQKVKVRSSIESHDTGGRSSLTEPLDEFFTAEKFFEGLIENFKLEAGELKIEAVHKSDTEFTLLVQADLPLPEEMTNPETGQSTWQLKLCKTVITDPVNLQICTHEHILDELILTGFYKVHRDPVRCEFWQMLPNGTRRGGGREACMMRLKLIRMISEAEVKGDIEALFLDQNAFFG